MEQQGAIYYDSKHDDETRRKNLYAGAVYVYSPRTSTLALRNLAASMIEEAFTGLDPLRAQYAMPVEHYVDICAPLKPKFIHDPHTKNLVRNIMGEFQCDLEKTYQDVPRLRMVTSDAYLTSGVGYAHHPHRDTWYSAPMCQINWWMPLYDFEVEASMPFHLNYWSREVKNGSDEFNYYQWNSDGRKNASKHVHQDTRKQPKALEDLDLSNGVRLVCEPGAVILFSAAQLHSTNPNTTGLTRYSLDFRTANGDDIQLGIGALNVDSRSVGTSLRDFLRSSDFAQLPEEVVAKYDESEIRDGVVTFNQDAARKQIQELSEAKVCGSVPQ
ncbi:MAG: hypothetical protein ABI811_06315 [Acidobacteriota bacterium]